MWLEIELDTSSDQIRVTARGKRGERPPVHTMDPEQGFDMLQSFSNKVGRAVRTGRSLDPAVVETAQALYEQVFKGELRDVLARMTEAAKDQPVLVRLFVHDRALAAVPWEALCRPGTTEGFLGMSPRTLVARGVLSSDPWEPREVRGAVRVLAVAPGSDERALLVLKMALDPAIEAGEVEWLEPIAGPDVSVKVLFDRLRRGKTPHIVHYLGHGGIDMAGKPVLRLADDEDEDGEEVWITAEAFARELSAGFYEELRLVILEACEGAKAGVLGSAAESFAKAGADAVIAHLWPVKADVARTCSSEIYSALTGAGRREGDVGASVAAARRTLLAQSAEAFSPILFLRGSDSVLFNFEGRRVNKPSGKRSSRNLAPALQSLLEKPFHLVLGDMDEDRSTLRRELSQFMEENGDKPAEGLSLSALTQRCALRFGQEVLHSIFQSALDGSLQMAAPPLIDAIGRLVPPGLHVTLLWRPYLERAVAEKQPGRTIYAIQPSTTGGKPRIVKRLAGASTWRMEPVMPRRFDVENEILIFRPYGGYSAEPRPILSSPLLTEDDYVSGLLGADGLKPPSWLEELLARPRIHPGLFVGLSVLDAHHRMLLQWLYDRRPAPKDSLAVLPPGTDPFEPEIWDSGGGLPGTGRIASITEDPAQLAPLIEGYSPGGGP